MSIWHGVRVELLSTVIKKDILIGGLREDKRSLSLQDSDDGRGGSRLSSVSLYGAFRIMVHNRKAFTLVEFILITALLAIFAAIAVPRLNFANVSKYKANSVARKMVTDLRRTRQMAIADAVDNNKGFELNMLGSDPFTGYNIVNVNSGDTVETHSIDSDVTVSGDSKFRFGPQGNITVAGHTEITVSAQGKTFTITVIVATGSITCVEN